MVEAVVELVEGIVVAAVVEDADKFVVLVEVEAVGEMKPAVVGIEAQLFERP